MNYEIVVAYDQERGIGKGDTIPWRLRGDMRHFRRLTMQAPEGLQNAVVMGASTWDSLPARFRPLPGRLNLVLSRRRASVEGAVVVRSWSALPEVLGSYAVHRVFIIGGAQIYARAIQDPRCTKIYATELETKASCDVFFPSTAGFALSEAGEWQHEGEQSYRILVLTRGACLSQKRHNL